MIEKIKIMIPLQREMLKVKICVFCAYPGTDKESTNVPVEAICLGNTIEVQ